MGSYLAFLEHKELSALAMRLVRAGVDVEGLAEDVAHATRKGVYRNLSGNRLLEYVARHVCEEAGVSALNEETQGAVPNPQLRPQYIAALQALQNLQAMLNNLPSKDGKSFNIRNLFDVRAKIYDAMNRNTGSNVRTPVSGGRYLTPPVPGAATSGRAKPPPLPRTATPATTTGDPTGTAPPEVAGDPTGTAPPVTSGGRQLDARGIPIGGNPFTASATPAKGPGADPKMTSNYPSNASQMVKDAAIGKRNDANSYILNTRLQAASDKRDAAILDKHHQGQLDAQAKADAAAKQNANRVAFMKKYGFANEKDLAAFLKRYNGNAGVNAHMRNAAQAGLTPAEAVRVMRAGLVSADDGPDFWKNLAAKRGKLNPSKEKQ